MLLTEIKTVSNISNYQPPSNSEDIIKLNIPLLIRLLEYSREELKDDATLHDMVENIIKLRNDVLTMKDYESIVDLKPSIDSIKMH